MMREVPFKGIGPQPPETVILNRGNYSMDQRQDAVNAFEPTRQQLIEDMQRRTVSRNRLLTQVAIHDIETGTDVLGGFPSKQRDHFLALGRQAIQDEASMPQDPTIEEFKALLRESSAAARAPERPIEEGDKEDGNNNEK